MRIKREVQGDRAFDRISFRVTSAFRWDVNIIYVLGAVIRVVNVIFAICLFDCVPVVAGWVLVGVPLGVVFFYDFPNGAQLSADGCPFQWCPGYALWAPRGAGPPRARNNPVTLLR